MDFLLFDKKFFFDKYRNTLFDHDKNLCLKSFSFLYRNWKGL